MYIINRRSFLTSAGVTALAYTIPGAFAELIQTPRQTEGPFYPNQLPLDTDNDLIIVNDSLTPAVGTITHLSGTVMDIKGNPVRNALVEIWQVDNNASYIHTKDRNHSKRDTHFQGFGRFLTNSKGQYYFRTIKPVAYPGRTPHIHVAVKIKGKKRLVTQCYIKGEARNARDGVLKRIQDAKQRQSIIIDFAPIKESKTGELQARFDLVLGFTPEDAPAH
jgi:protocatechuate 3,4-dioxygenase beta subunit